MTLRDPRANAADSEPNCRSMRWIVVIASYLREKLLEPQRERYRNQGRHETANRWREWNERRVEALSMGEDFNEPPPEE